MTKVDIKAMAKSVAKEIRANEAKGKVLDPDQKRSENDIQESAKQVARFYKGLITGDYADIHAMQKDIAQEYQAKSQNVTTAADGGVLVPVSLFEEFVTKRDAQNPVRQFASVFSAVEDVKIPVENAQATAVYDAEEDAPADTKTTMNSYTLQAHKLVANVPVTRSFLRAASTGGGAQNLLAQTLARAVGRAEGTAFVSGTGTNEPEGFVTQGGQTASGVQQAATVTFDDVIEIANTATDTYLSSGVWVTSQKGAGAIRKLEDTSGRKIVTTDASRAFPTDLLGRPLVVMDAIDDTLATNTETQLWLIDFSYYFIKDAEALRIELGTSGDDFKRDRMTMRAVTYNDGKLVLAEAATVGQIQYT